MGTAIAPAPVAGNPFSSTWNRIQNAGRAVVDAGAGAVQRISGAVSGAIDRGGQIIASALPAIVSVVVPGISGAVNPAVLPLVTYTVARSISPVVDAAPGRGPVMNSGVAGALLLPGLVAREIVSPGPRPAAPTEDSFLDPDEPALTDSAPASAETTASRSATRPTTATAGSSVGGSSPSTSVSAGDIGMSLLGITGTTPVIAPAAASAPIAAGPSTPGGAAAAAVPAGSLDTDDDANAPEDPDANQAGVRMYFTRLEGHSANRWCLVTTAGVDDEGKGMVRDLINSSQFTTGPAKTWDVLYVTNETSFMNWVRKIELTKAIRKLMAQESEAGQYC